MHTNGGRVLAKNEGIRVNSRSFVVVRLSRRFEVEDFAKHVRRLTIAPWDRALPLALPTTNLGELLPDFALTIGQLLWNLDLWHNKEITARSSSGRKPM